MTAYLFFGWPMLAVYVFMVACVLLGDWFPGVLHGSSEDWVRVAERPPPPVHPLAGSSNAGGSPAGSGTSNALRMNDTRV